jgi:hypothetical protein
LASLAAVVVVEDVVSAWREAQHSQTTPLVVRIWESLEQEHFLVNLKVRAVRFSSSHQTQSV